ncbi:38584_t:CDS:1, partial [Gigaspora margarita]
IAFLYNNFDWVAVASDKSGIALNSAAIASDKSDNSDSAMITSY